MDEKDFSEYTFYWIKESEISTDEFIMLEQTALLENSLMKFRVFMMYDPGNMPRIMTGLN